MCVYGPHFALRCECVYMVLTLHSDVNVYIWSSLYLQLCMCVHGPHFIMRCECMYMAVTGINKNKWKNTIITISLLTECILDISVSGRLLPELAWL